MNDKQRQRTYNVGQFNTVTDQDIADWVVTAFEGDSSYWCGGAEAVERDDKGDFQSLTEERNEEFVVDGVGAYANRLYWENGKRGYRLTDHEGEEVPHVLTMSGLLKALNYQPPQKRACSYNWMRALGKRLITGEYDSGDADTIVQIAVFGGVVYG